MLEYPKYVEPHGDFVVREDGKPVNVPAWPDFHVGRDGTVTVLVRDENEEALVTGASPVPPAAVDLPTPAPDHAPQTTPNGVTPDNPETTNGAE